MVDGIVDRWLSVSEAARQLSVSRQAIHHRIKRGTLLTQVNNQGQRLVKIPSTVPRAVTGSNPPGTVDSPGVSLEPPPSPAHEPEPAPLSAHRETIEALQAAHRESLAAVQSQHRDQVAQYRDQVVQLRSDMSELQKQHRADLAAERKRHNAELASERVWVWAVAGLALAEVLIVGRWIVAG